MSVDGWVGHQMEIKGSACHSGGGEHWRSMTCFRCAVAFQSFRRAALERSRHGFVFNVDHVKRGMVRLAFVKPTAGRLAWSSGHLVLPMTS